MYAPLNKHGISFFNNKHTLKQHVYQCGHVFCQVKYDPTCMCRGSSLQRLISDI